MKRIISIKSVSLCLLMCMAAFSFAGCSSEDEDKPGGNNVKVASEDNTEATDTEAGEYQQGDIEYTSGDKWQLSSTYADTMIFDDSESHEQCNITVTATETTYLKKLEKEYIASMEDTYGTDYVSANKKFGLIFAIPFININPTITTSNPTVIIADKYTNETNKLSFFFLAFKLFSIIYQLL